MKKLFQNIVVQSKADKDFRSFAHVTDSKGNNWELRGYGKTAGEAADDGFLRFKEDERHWENFGYMLNCPKETGLYVWNKRIVYLNDGDISDPFDYLGSGFRGKITDKKFKTGWGERLDVDFSI